MAVVPVKCPNCSGEIQLDDSMEKGFCMFCGSQLIVSDLVKRDIDPKEVLYKRAEQFIGEQKFDKAKELYQKVLDEIDPHDSHCWWQLLRLSLNLQDRFRVCLQPIGTPEDTIKEFENSDHFKYALQYANDERKQLYLKEWKETCNYIHKLYEKQIEEYKKISAGQYDSLLGCWSCAKFIEYEGELYSISSPSGGMYYLTKIFADNGLLECSKPSVWGIFDNEWTNGGLKEVVQSKKPYQSINLHFVNEDKIYYDLRIQDRIPNDEWPDIPQYKAFDNPEVVKKQTSGCYIATAVYGSYSAPEVMVLRTFRDNTLKASRLGRAFIACYYKLSPPIAERLKHHKHMNGFVKSILNQFINVLRKRNKR